jgi:hypothetical protein
VTGTFTNADGQGAFAGTFTRRSSPWPTASSRQRACSRAR